MGIRPRDVLNHKEQHEEQDDTENCITGKIEAVEHLGNESFIYLSHPDIHEFFTVCVEDSRCRESGSDFHVGVPAENCHVFDDTGKAFSRTRAPHWE